MTRSPRDAADRAPASSARTGAAPELSAACSQALARVTAAAAAGVGAVLVHWRYGTVPFETAPVTPQNRVYYFAEAPPVFFAHGPLQIATTLLFPAAVAALVYALIAVATPRDDLGAWPAQEHAFAMRP